MKPLTFPSSVTVERWPWAVRSIIGCIAGCLAIGLTYSIAPLRAFPLLLGFPTVILAAWFLGTSGGAFCALSETVLVDSFLTKTQMGFSTGDTREQLRLIVFLVISTFVGWAIRQLSEHRTQLSTQELERLLDKATGEHLLAEERNRSTEAQARLAAIVDSSDDAIVSKDLNGAITSWNAGAQQVFGYTAQEIIGHSIFQIIPPELHHEEEEILRRLRTGERVDHFETTRLRKTGERINVSVTISPLRDDKGRIIGASKIARDITQQKKIEQMLIQSEKLAATGRMAATVAHEINNPLESVMNLIYLARVISDPGSEIRSFLEIAEREIQRVSHIAQQTLGFYRDPGRPIEIHCRKLIAQVLEVYQSRLAARGISVECCVNDNRPLLVHKGELVQVISNLISNAADAMPQGGQLLVKTEECTDAGQVGIRVSIIDEGLGIPSANLERIFEPFFTTKGTLGTGIGLWVAKRLVENRGGQISVSSPVHLAGSGTRVDVWLPFEMPPYDDQEQELRSGAVRAAER